MEFLLLAIVIGFCSAQITRVLDFSFNEGNILDWYYILLIKYLPKKLSKPLGTCIKCFSVWVCLVSFLPFCIFYTLPWYYIIISEGISAFIIFKGNKYL